ELAREDPEHVTLVVDALLAEGVDIREHAHAYKVERRGKTGVRVHVRNEDGSEDIIDGTHLLAAPQYVPALEGLDPDKAGIRHSPDGIEVDAGLRTSNKRIYAIGDVTGKGGWVHLAEQHAHLVADALLRRKGRSTASAASPRAVFTSPQI